MYVHLGINGTLKTFLMLNQKSTLFFITLLDMIYYYSIQIINVNINTALA